jgi:hypothetical protein
MNRGFYKALSVSVAVALLPSCGGSQQIGQTASPQLRRDATSTPLPGGAVSHRASRPLARYPKRRHGLLYVGATYYTNAIDIFPLTGPNQQQVGSITNGIDAPWGLSVDSNKSLYVANAGNGTVTVYPYGSSTPSMTYSIFGAALYALADSAGHVFLSGKGDTYTRCPAHSRRIPYRPNMRKSLRNQTESPSPRSSRLASELKRRAALASGLALL